MSYQLGIDVGTTYTAAAICRSSDRRWVEPEVVTLGTRSATVASVLFVAPDGGVLVGEAAERRALTDPDRVVREFKRRIGDPTPVVVAGRSWAPEELSARLVRWVVDRVAEREGGAPARIAVTHPASWGSHKKDLFGAALASVGLNVTFLAEPQAAALHYAAAERVPTGATIAVYDLGGGTFDAAVVRKGEASAGGAAGFELLGRPEGLERLGGIDFDEAVFEHVREGLPKAFENLDETDPAVLSAVSRVRRECTEAKEALSSDTEVSIPVLLPATRGSVRLHRSEFESLIRARVEETVTALRTAVRSAKLEPAQLTAVLLVGGSSRVPLVAQLVSEQLGRPVAVDTDPKNAIAMGAALAISPRPTESRAAGAAVPPGPAAAAGRPAGAGRYGIAGAAAGAAAAAAAAAGAGLGAAPPRPPLGTPSQGFGRPPGSDRPAGPTRPAGPPSGRPPGSDRSSGPPPAAPHRPSGPSHEPATSLLSSGERPGGRGPVRPVPPDVWPGEPEPEPRRRRTGLLLGIGGAVAAAALIGAVALWGQPPDPEVGRDSTTSGTTTSPEDATPSVVPPGPTPGATPTPAGNGSGGSGESGGGGRTPSPSPSPSPEATSTPTPAVTPTPEPEATATPQPDAQPADTPSGDLDPTAAPGSGTVDEPPAGATGAQPPATV